MTFHKTSNQQPVEYDVIVSGAGPVGLFLACELALAKCSVLVLERAEELHSPLKRLPFGLRGLNALSVEALYRRGLLEQLEVPKRLTDPHSHAVQGPRRQVGHFAGIPLLAGNIDASLWSYRLPGSTDTSLLAEMEELVVVLTRRAEASGVEIRRGLAVTGLEQTGNSVTVICCDRSFQAQWLVGCDGARSAVRRAAGFEFAGTEPEFTGYSAQVDLADPEKLKPGRNITPTGMYLQSQPGYLVIQDFDGGVFHSADMPITLEHLQAVLRRISNTDVTIRAVHAATTWTDRARQATAYRSGRVLLAGDAAHIHAPLGGQGLNLGLGDAMNLGWKLAATIHGKAPQGLLDTYQAERHPIAARVLDWSRAQAAIMKTDPGARALHAIMRDLMETHDVATYVAERLWGVTTCYDLAGGHPLIGRSVPNFELENSVRVGELMHDGRGLLLDFEGSPSLKMFASGYDDQLRYVSGRAKEQFGLCAVLIRPDGIVAWAAESDAVEPSLRQAAELWFAGMEAK
jgi:2-polyprenyl-6-methoxyphenol hydroxylase-like FAD-dependent oxidoreductase